MSWYLASVRGATPCASRTLMLTKPVLYLQNFWSSALVQLISPPHADALLPLVAAMDDFPERFARAQPNSQAVAQHHLPHLATQIGYSQLHAAADAQLTWLGG